MLKQLVINYRENLDIELSEESLTQLESPKEFIDNSNIKYTYCENVLGMSRVLLIEPQDDLLLRRFFSRRTGTENTMHYVADYHSFKQMFEDTLVKELTKENQLIFFAYSKIVPAFRDDFKFIFMNCILNRNIFIPVIAIEKSATLGFNQSFYGEIIHAFTVMLYNPYLPLYLKYNIYALLLEIRNQCVILSRYKILTTININGSDKTSTVIYSLKEILENIDLVNESGYVSLRFKKPLTKLQITKPNFPTSKISEVLSPASLLDVSTALKQKIQDVKSMGILEINRITTTSLKPHEIDNLIKEMLLRKIAYAITYLCDNKITSLFTQTYGILFNKEDGELYAIIDDSCTTSHKHFNIYTNSYEGKQLYGSIKSVPCFLNLNGINKSYLDDKAYSIMKECLYSYAHSFIDHQEEISESSIEQVILGKTIDVFTRRTLNGNCVFLAKHLKYNSKSYIDLKHVSGKLDSCCKATQSTVKGNSKLYVIKV